MMDWLNALEPYWTWLIVGMLLATAEIIVPGFFLIWFAAAAIVTGVLSFLLPISGAAQIGLFAVLAVAAVYAGRRWFATNPIISSDPKLNDRGARLTGEIVTVVDAIRNGQGRVKVGDTVWSARGNDADMGTQVRITGSTGASLLVEPV
jgi:membrane protein implicated in regulation of membrane protease activity